MMKRIFFSGILFLLCFFELTGQDNKASIMLGRTTIFTSDGYGNNLKVSSDGTISAGSTSSRTLSKTLPYQLCVIDAGEGKVAFKTAEGKYLTSGGGGNVCSFTKDNIGTYEKFTVRHTGNGAFSIKSTDGKYLLFSANVLSATGTDEATAKKFYFATFVMMQAHNGMLVMAEPVIEEYSNSDGRCVVVSTEFIGVDYSASTNNIDGKTVWRFEDMGNGKMNPYINEYYFSLSGDQCTGTRENVKQHLTLHYLGAGQFALQPSNGKYFCAASNQNTTSGRNTKLVGSATRVSTWEKFRLLNPNQNMGEGCSNDVFLAKAVARNNAGDVNNLLAKGAKPSTEQLNTAMAKNPGIAQNLMKYGAAPDASTMDMAVKSRDKASTEMIIGKGVKPTLAHFQQMLAAKDYEMAKIITNKGGVMPTNNELKTAVDKSDLTAAQIITARGVKGDVGILNKSISMNNRPMYDHLSAGIAPDASSLKTAQTANNMDFFMAIIGRGVRCSDENIKMAIDKDQFEFAKVALTNGSNASTGLTHAVSKSKKNFMVLCLDNAADANLALNYAVTKSDLEFARVLITNYNASGNKLLDEAIKAKKIDFGQVAFVNGKADPNLRLKSVADANNMSFVNLMLDHGGDVNLAMHGVIEHKQVTVLKRLIGAGANVNKPEHLVLAVQKKSLEMTTMLVDAGANANPGMKPAIAQDSYSIISFLLSKGASPIGHLVTPACNGKTKTVKLLLDYKGDPNEGMKCATEKNFSEMTHMLLSAGAKPNGFMVIPANKGYEQVVKYLVEFGAPAQEGIKASVEGNHTKIVDFLLTSGAKPKDLVKIAANHNNPQVVSLLCKFGDAPKPGMMPAVTKGFVEVAQVLVGLGVDPKPYEYLRAAVDNNKAPMAKFLLDNGSDVNHKVENDLTLLHIAANNRAAGELVKVLLEKGADVNAVETKNGNTPLHVAVRHKQEKGNNNMVAVEALVKAGAGVNNVNWVSNTGKTVRQYARGAEVKAYIKNSGGAVAVKKALSLGGVGGPDADHAATAEDEPDEEE